MCMTLVFSNPREAVLQLGLKEGMRIADLGCGTGHYAAAAAGAVGESGRVYAVDVRGDVLEHAKRVQGVMHPQHRRGVIEPVWGDIERVAGTGLRDSAVDAVIVANVLFQIDRRDALVAEIRRIVKPGGKMLLVDWAGSYGGMGPAPSQVVPEHEAEALCIGAGFHKVKSFRAGPHHYGIVCTVS